MFLVGNDGFMMSQVSRPVIGWFGDGAEGVSPDGAEFVSGLHLTQKEGGLWRTVAA